MRTLTIIALIAATASPALASIPATDVAQPAPYSALDTGDRQERAKIFDTSELSGSERSGLTRTGALDPGDRKEREKIFQLSELSAAERQPGL